MGGARVTLRGGHLFRFKFIVTACMSLPTNRGSTTLSPTPASFDILESESLLIGENFGIATDIETGPDGNVFVVSNTDGAVYEIFRRH